jgi:mRNA-degrading endonuclease RelE of RelBE toxin-antitoxin system
MKTTAYRKLDKLNPNFRKKVEKFLTEVNLKENLIFITESWRSAERQAELIRA